MSTDGQRTKRRRNIAENFNRLSSGFAFAKMNCRCTWLGYSTLLTPLLYFRTIDYLSSARRHTIVANCRFLWARIAEWPTLRIIIVMYRIYRLQKTFYL